MRPRLGVTCTPGKRRSWKRRISPMMTSPPASLFGYVINTWQPSAASSANASSEGWICRSACSTSVAIECWQNKIKGRERSKPNCAISSAGGVKRPSRARSSAGRPTVKTPGCASACSAGCSPAVTCLAGSLGWSAGCSNFTNCFVSGFRRCNCRRRPLVLPEAHWRIYYQPDNIISHEQRGNDYLCHHGR